MLVVGQDKLCVSKLLCRLYIYFEQRRTLNLEMFDRKNPKAIC